MNYTEISAEVIADSLSPQKERLTSMLVTFPRIILSEMNTHRMLAKNTSSSRAIPFIKLITSILDDPFIPIAWQKHHPGMQGSEYFEGGDVATLRIKWRLARDQAVEAAMNLASGVFPPDEIFEWDELGNLKLTGSKQIQVTKQLCNRLLEPFMWVTAVITGNKESWDNFFELRSPVYVVGYNTFKSKKEVIDYYLNDPDFPEIRIYSDLHWLKNNKGQAEIHIMELAEKVYDAMKESTPKQLQAGEWHIPFEDKMDEHELAQIRKSNHPPYDELKVKVSTAMSARTSYTVVGNETEMSYEKMIDLSDSLITRPYTMLNGTVIEEWEPIHASPTDHCSRAMNNEEYYSYVRGKIKVEEGHPITETNPKSIFGWCRQYKGFIPYRHILEEGLDF